MAAPPAAAGTVGGVPSSVAAPGVSDPALAEEITVLGRKLQEMRFKFAFRSKEGVTTLRSCKITKSSKDKLIDAIPCAVARECAAEPGLDQKGVFACVEKRGQDRILALAEARQAEQDMRK